MGSKLSKEEVHDIIIDALNDCYIYGVNDDDEHHTASYVLAALEDEGVIDDREVDL